MINLCRFVGLHTLHASVIKCDASYGYYEAKDEYCYEFKGHFVVTLEGVMSGYTFAKSIFNEISFLRICAMTHRLFLVPQVLLANWH